MNPMCTLARRGAWLSAALLLAFLPLSASALTFINAGAYTSPQTVGIGKSVGFTIVPLSPEAVSNVTFTFQVRPYTPGGAISPNAVYTHTVTGQDFAANERKTYKLSFTIPVNLPTGEYLWTTKATNAAGTVTYMDVARINSMFTFHADGVAARHYVRGVNIMDMGNTEWVLPGIMGTHYPKPTLAGLQRLKARGLDVVRIPFLWERIQPVPNGALNTTYLGYVLDTLEYANAAGLGVILDMHNYAHYTVSGVRQPFGSPTAPTKAQYADAWRRIASAVRSNPAAYSALYAWDIMNEPHDLPYDEGTYANPVTFASFESGTEGWTTAASHTLARVVRDNQGSLRLTVPARSGSGIVLGTGLSASVKRAALANGPTFQAKVFVPESTPGTISARMSMVNSAYQYQFSATFALKKGVENRIYFKPPESAWSNNRSLSVDFIVDGSDGSAPLVFYVDHVSQGTQSGERTPAQVWEDYSQVAVDAIRALGDTRLIMVEGYSWASAEVWPKSHPVKWVNDPADNIMYHAHFYFDRSGKYEVSHAALTSSARSGGHASIGAMGVARLKNFTDWVAAQGTRGFIGEFGWPNSVRRPSEAAAWNADAEQVLQFLDDVGMGATLWTAGTWERANNPSVNINTLYQIEPTFAPLSQAEVLERHLGQP